VLSPTYAKPVGYVTSLSKMGWLAIIYPKASKLTIKQHAKTMAFECFNDY